MIVVRTPLEFMYEIDRKFRATAETFMVASIEHRFPGASGSDGDS
jgi:hypothetical protein